VKPYYEDPSGKIYCADWRELQSQSADLLLSDPQYQLANGKKATTMNATAKRGAKLLKGTVTIPKDWGHLQGDDEPFDPSPFLRFPKVILWGALHYANKLPNSTSWLVWDKRDGVASDDNADGELAWSNIGGPLRIHRQLWKGICRAGRENIATQGDKLHPFQKPVSLMRWCISLVPDAQIILDPFAGSGSTLLAAKEQNRQFIGIEIEERYCEIAAKRMSQEVLQFT
jgi:hypothetical protein